MKFRARFKQLEINLPTVQKSIDDVMEVAVRQGAQVWLAAATGRIPLWTGMARASLLKLSELVNGKVVLSPLKGKSRIAQGRALGSAKVVIQRPSYFFEVSTDVPHFVQQDAGAGRSPTAPWRSFEAGQAAFEAFAKQVELPVVNFIEREISVG